MSLYNTNILDEDLGYITIPNPEITSVWNGHEFSTNFTRETKQLVEIRFRGGNYLTCSPDTQFFSKHKKIWVEAQNLKTNAVVLGSSALPDFDYLDLTSFKYLKYLDSYNAGMLVATSKLFAQKNTYKLRFQETKLRKLLEYWLTVMNVDFTTEELENQVRPQIKYILASRELITECETFVSKTHFNDEVWKSKRFLKGFLQVLSEFTTICNNTLSLRLHRSLARDMQQALYVFGVGSHITHGLITNYLTIDKRYFPTLAKNIGALNVNKTLLFYNNNFFTSTASKKPLTFKVLDVTITDKYVEMFNMQDTQVVSNGLITK